MPIVSPRYIYREDAGEALRDIIVERSVSKILIVTDRVIESTNHFGEVVEKIASTGAEHYVFSDVEQEPSFETARRIGLEALKLEADLIVAIGGGSVIDAAKGGYVLYEKPDVTLEELNPFEPLGLGRKAVLVAVPTTCGTGSDASFGIVLTLVRDRVKRKVALGHREVVPYASILDTAFLSTLPRSLIRNTALDALSHAVEAFVAVMANTYTDSLAKGVVLTIFSFLKKGIEKDEHALSQLHLAATMAGIAFTNAGLGLAHAIAHTIGPVLGLHHGLAVSIALPYVVAFNSSKDLSVKDKYESLVPGSSGEVDRFEVTLIRLYREIGHPTSYSEVVDVDIGEWRKIAEQLAPLVLEDATLAFNPVSVGVDDVEEVLLNAFTGRLDTS